MLIAVIAGNVQCANPATVAQMFKGSLKGTHEEGIPSSRSVDLIGATVERIKKF